MEIELCASFVAILLTTMLFLKTISTRCSRRKYNLPPGPKPWPIIGNLNLIGALPHRSIHELSRRYGPLVYLRFGSFPVVVGSSVEMARFFLKTRDAAFIDRPRTAAGKHTAYNYRDITWSPCEAYWRQARRVVLTELFSARRIESYEHIRREEVHALLRDLHYASSASASSGGRRAIVIKDYLSTASLNMITRMVMGKRYVQGEVVHEEPGSARTTLAQFKELLEELFFLNGVFNVGDQIPWLEWLDLQGYVKRMKKVSKALDHLLEHVVDEHSERRQREGNGFVARDMVDVLLRLADDSSLEVKLSRDSIKAFTQDHIAGSTESSSETIEWAISELLRKPEMFTKATEELDRIVGHRRWVNEKDTLDLPYIEAIEFVPERFLGKKIDVKGQDFELLPFGSGRWMCPGYNLGLKVIQLSIANLLHGFTWRLPKDMVKEDLSMEEIFGLSMPRKFPLEVAVEPKLSSHLYKGD
uniref:Cytochrome P450 n=1 Tax=Oryza meridionalis TaxID=40149 RepID=A0A0E0ESN9_9ORYZ